MNRDRIHNYKNKGLNVDHRDYYKHYNLLVCSQIIQPGDSNPLHVYMENIGDEDISLDYGIAYACVYGPDLTKTPKVVITEKIQEIRSKNVSNPKLVYYNSVNAFSFRELVKQIEKDDMINSGHIFYNGDPKW